MPVGTGRPPEADARKLIRSFLDGEGYQGVPFRLLDDGDGFWAWWILPEDDTSYCFYNSSNAIINKDDGLCVEWLGTAEPVSS